MLQQKLDTKKDHINLQKPTGSCGYLQKLIALNWIHWCQGKTEGRYNVYVNAIVDDNIDCHANYIDQWIESAI